MHTKPAKIGVLLRNIYPYYLTVNFFREKTVLRVGEWFSIPKLA